VDCWILCVLDLRTLRLWWDGGSPAPLR